MGWLSVEAIGDLPGIGAQVVELRYCLFMISIVVNS
jgi:hypothetical protein